IDETAVCNHVVNQLAFSRLSSSPLSLILRSLPEDQRRGLSRERLRRVLEAAPCVGAIPRMGKDAAGKPLEAEYYYMPEADQDEQRRAAVVDGLRKPTLRNCRKQHKVSTSQLTCSPPHPLRSKVPLTFFHPLQQYYWKRPRTP